MSYIKRKLEDIMRDYICGMSIKTIAAKHNVPRVWVRDSINIMKEGMFEEYLNKEES